jgi:hypothetical protein
MSPPIDCPRCDKPLVYADELLDGCEGGCSKYLIEEALNGRGPVPSEGSNGHAPVDITVTGLSAPAPAEVLDELVGFVRRFVSMTESEAVAVALWIFHTHAIGAAQTTPYIAITSAEKESGKTLLLEVLNLLVARPWLTGRTTAAVLPRKIEVDRPTLLLDESDAAFKGDRDYAEALRGVLNTGYRRSGKTTVCVGQGVEIGFKDFSTFCPKAIAGIGRLPDTVQSRSIPVRLKRKAPGESVERFRERDVTEEAQPLRAGSSWSHSRLCPNSRPPAPSCRRNSEIAPRMSGSRCSPSPTSPGSHGPSRRGRPPSSSLLARRRKTTRQGSGCWPTSSPSS